MLQAWKDTLKELWYRTNYLLLNTIWFFCGFSVDYEKWREHYEKDTK